jgi:D-xylose transport system permease protein
MSNKEAAGPAALDRSDVRMRHEESMIDAFWSFVDRVRSGDLGMLPVVVGLVLISIIFSSLNPVFLAPNNLVNLLFDCATVGVISLGIVCVLMLGEIDLSVGSMSGFASALVGVLWVNSGWPVVGAILVAIAAGMAVGFLYAVLYNRLGMPSFIASLSGLLAILGMQLYILGPTGSINLPYASPLVSFGQILIMPAWLSHLLGLAPGAVLVLSGLSAMRRRRDAGLSASPITFLIVKALVLTALLEFGVYYLNLGRGVPWMFGFFVLLVVVLNY